MTEAPTSVPDPIAPRKLSRLGLYVPFALLGVFILAWSAGWVWARGQVVTRMDAGAAALRKAGYELGWNERRIGGYPFRLNVSLTDARLADRSGWALEAPRIEAQAFMHAPTSWVIAAPQSLTFVRPEGGPVRVQGKLIRASLTRLNTRPPNLSFEGVGLTFEPTAGAQPFGLTAADRIEFHIRKAPKEVGDEAGVWLMVKGGRARLSGLLGRIAADKPIAIEWDGRLSKIGDFRGATWGDAVRAWTAAGGRMAVKRAGLTAGDAVIGVSGGALRVDGAGRLAGVLEVSLRQAPRALEAMNAVGAITRDQAEVAMAVTSARQQGADIARATINFEAGQTTLGPVALAPAPKVYEPR